MVQFTLPANSKVRRGKVWPEPSNASHTKRFRIYRWNPDERNNPRFDVFTLDLDDCGPMGSVTARAFRNTSRGPNVLIMRSA